MIVYDGMILKLCNIIGVYKFESKKCILFCVYWDSCLYVDNDFDLKNYYIFILGVNDGVSGVGVLLEIVC